MMKLMVVVGTMVVAAGCAGSAEDSTSSLTSAVSAASSSSGSDNASDGQGGHHRGPPPEAFTACEGKSAGDACTMTHGEATLAGTCVTPPSDAPDTRIICRPDNMPEGGPPPGGGGDCPRGDGQKPEEKPADSAPAGS